MLHHSWCCSSSVSSWGDSSGQFSLQSFLPASGMPVSQALFQARSFLDISLIPCTETAPAAADAPLRTQPGHHQASRSEEHTSELQSQSNLVCRLLLEKKKSLLLFYSTFRVTSLLANRATVAAALPSLPLMTQSILCSFWSLLPDDLAGLVLPISPLHT